MNLSKIILVLKREYVTRIRSKGFIITTLLIPLGMLAIIGVSIFIATLESGTQRTIGIADQTQVIYPRLEKIDPQQYQNYANVSEDSLKALVTNGLLDGYIKIEDNNVSELKSLNYISNGSGGIDFLSNLETDLNQAIRSERLSRAEVSDTVQQIYESSLDLNNQTISEKGTLEEANTGFLSVIGLFMGMIIFGTIAGYGGMLTRSVIEEKTNRIIEIITSSVKPIELLLGKMAGIGALGITQLIFWLATIFGLAAAAGPVIGIIAGAPEVSAEAAGPAPDGFDPATFSIPSVPPSLILYFVLFFVLGYLLYSSLFAAMGSAVDSQTDTQQLMFPIMVPIMIGYFIMFQAMNNPDSTLAVVGSIIPFCAPIVMITRIAITEVPFWQIALSIILMLGTFAITMWLSAKIYRIGILSYGSTANYKELWKWIQE